jgi:1-acyl-sn-glycerol-3-phosphate acyltransferase
VTAFVNAVIRAVVGLLCRVDVSELERVPRKGPLIMISNHINFLEVPLLYTLLQPRPLVGLVKVETWNSPPLAFLANLWKAIPVRRGTADLAAFRKCVSVLRQGKILAVAPEGTRSGDGRLGRGHPGVVHLALQGGFPVLPVAHFGGEKFWTNLRRLRRTRVHVRVGCPFVLEPRATPVTREDRWAMTHEIMERIADLLPPRYRGVYGSRRAPQTGLLRDVNLSGGGYRQR